MAHPARPRPAHSLKLTLSKQATGGGGGREGAAGGVEERKEMGGGHRGPAQKGFRLLLQQSELSEASKCPANPLRTLVDKAQGPWTLLGARKSWWRHR